MKNSITRIIAVIFSVVTSSAALADGHYNGQGFSSNISSTTLEGKTGSIIHMINEDFWQYQNAPEGWPTAAMATCHFTMMIAAGRASPFINKWRL